MDQTLLANLTGTNEEKIFSLLFSEDDLTWQTIIYELVKTEAMDPWDINVSVIAEKFITMLRKLKELDFRIGGKMVLAAALLLKIKSERLINEDIMALDNIIASSDDPLDILEELSDSQGRVRLAGPELIPRTPQPRQRKVSVYDLVEALEKALNTETRKTLQRSHQTTVIAPPKKGRDMTDLINDVYGRVRKGLSSKKTVLFSQLIPSESKEDKVFTFIPLLHLDTQRKVDLVQKEHFDDFQIKINTFAINAQAD